MPPSSRTFNSIAPRTPEISAERPAQPAGGATHARRQKKLDQPPRSPQSGRAPAPPQPSLRRPQRGVHILRTPPQATKSTLPRSNRLRRVRRLQSCRLKFPTSPTTRWRRLGLPRGRRPRSGTDLRTRPATLKLTSWNLKSCRAHDRESRGPPDVAAVRPGHFDLPSSGLMEKTIASRHSPTHPPVRQQGGSGLRCHTATGSTNLRCGVPYIPTFPNDDSDSRRWFLCDSAICLLVAGVDTLGGREGEP